MHRHPSRRDLLKMAYFGPGLIGLRAMASGIPPEVLRDPRALLTLGGEQKDAAGSAYGPQFLVLAVSDQGEPRNCNVPNMYEDPKFIHPSNGIMAPTSFSLGGTAVKAALP